MTATRTNIDVAKLKSAAAGRWLEIILAICSVLTDILDGRHHPCPKCGGTDRFRVFDDFADTGGMYCNQCHSEKNGDGIASVQWLLGCDFATALRKIADFLGMSQGTPAKQNGKPRTNGKKQVAFRDKAKWRPLPNDTAGEFSYDRSLKQFAAAKPPIHIDAIKAAGGRLCSWPPKANEPLPCVAFPAQRTGTGDVTGWILYRIDGKDLPAIPKGPDQRKTHNLRGSEDGWVPVGGWDAVKAATTVVKVEGVPDALAIQPRLPADYVVITNICGAGSKLKLPGLSGKRLIVIGDADTPGQKGAKQFAQRAAIKIDDVRIATLPFEVTENSGKDVRDFVAEGGDVTELLAEAEPVEPDDSPITPDIDNGCDDLPEVYLPGDDIPVSCAAKELGRLLAESGRYFRRGALVRLVTEDGQAPALRPVPPAALPAAFESVARLKKVKKKDGEAFAVGSICSEANARLISHAEQFLDEVPPIELVSPSPVVIEQDGQLVQVVGYDRKSRVLANGDEAPEMPLAEAITLLHQVVQDFEFAEPADRSRALASVITPAMVHGGLLGGRAPVDLSEADQSQTGKGYRNKLTASIYGQTVRAFTQRKGGVGSLEESLNSILIQGANFPCADNMRGVIDSPAIESFLTEDSYEARIPYSPSVEIKPHRIVLMMTSNQAELTPDLANRSSCVRVLKQPAGYQFAKYTEGDILDHIRANQPRFLGAVFAVIRKWHRQGKPRTSEARHDFRAWAQTLDWIVQNILGEAPLIDGHAETKARMTNPTLSWLRDVAIAVREDGSFNQFLRTHQILNIIANSQNVEIPSLSDGDDLEDDDTRNKILRSLGRKIGRCFRGDTATIDGYQITREETTDENGRNRKHFMFESSKTTSPKGEKTASEPNSPNRNENPLSPPEVIPELNLQSPEVPASSSNIVYEKCKDSVLNSNNCTEPMRGLRETSGLMRGSIRGDLGETSGNSSLDADNTAGQIRHKTRGCTSTGSWQHIQGGRYCEKCWPCTDDAMRVK